MVLYGYVKKILRSMSDTHHTFTTHKTHVGDTVWHLHTDIFWYRLATGVFARTPAFVGFKHSKTGVVVGGYVKLSSKIKPTKYRLHKVLSYFANRIIDNAYMAIETHVQTQGYNPFTLSKTKDARRFAIEKEMGHWCVAHMPIEDFDFDTWAFKTEANVQVYKAMGTYADGFFDMEDENFVYAENECSGGLSASATISLFDISNGWTKVADDVMPLGGHSSYPISFSHENQVYCIPNIWDGSIKNIPVWIRISTDKWHRNTQDIILPKPHFSLYHRPETESNGWRQDFTPFYHRGYWYGFTSRPACDVLYLYVADTPFGTWAEHPQSPICVGVNGSRMGGNIYVQDAKIYRFGQDTTHTYGGGLMVFEIANITPAAYAEIYIKHIQHPYKACHTFNVGQNRIVFDYRGNAHAKNIY